MIRSAPPVHAMRGVEKKLGQTVTSAMLGEFRNNKQTRDEFLSLVRSKQR